MINLKTGFRAINTSKKQIILKEVGDILERAQLQVQSRTVDFDVSAELLK